MSSDTASKSLYGSIWTTRATNGGVNKLTINFNQPKTCTVAIGSIPGNITCNYAESLTNDGHFFGLTGGSISLLGSCSVSAGTGNAQGIAAGTAILSFTLTKVAGEGAE